MNAVLEVKGGTLISVSSDDPNFRFYLVDWDNIAEGGIDELNRELADRLEPDCIGDIDSILSEIRKEAEEDEKKTDKKLGRIFNMKKILIKNPDPAGVYHVWHYCPKCFRAFKHSQAEFEQLNNNRSYKCCRDNLYDVEKSVEKVRLTMLENNVVIGVDHIYNTGHEKKIA